MSVPRTAESASFRVAPASESVNIGGGDAIQHFTNIKGASGISGVPNETLAGLAPGERVVIGSAKFNPGVNTFLTGEDGGVGVTKLGADASPAQLALIGVSGDRQQYVIEFSRETLLNNNVPLSAVKAERSIFSIPGNTTVKGTITIQRVR